MITVHHLLVSQSERIIWLLEELGLSYELKSYPRDPVGLADPIFLKLHPIGSAPVIQDGDITMAESSAIVSYILDVYGNGKFRIPVGQPGHADFVYWFNYPNAGFMPQAMQQLFDTLMGDTESMRSMMMRERFARHLGMVNDRLAKVPYLAGNDFTAADLMLQFPFGTMSAFSSIDISIYPHIRTWLDRISARPAYQKAMRLAGHEKDPAAAA